MSTVVLPPLAPNAQMRWAVVQQIVEAVAPSAILEIGCGQGAFGARLSSYGSYLGVEPDADSFRIAEQRIGPAGGQVRNIASGELPDTSEFDLVCAFEVLEHIESDSEAFESWASLVAPGGHLLISVPAWPDRFGEWDRHVGHYRRYTPNDLERLALASGLVPTNLIAYGWPLGSILEFGRNRIAGMRDRRSAGGSMSERTAGSGRTLQPTGSRSGRVLAMATLPFIRLQATRPTKGTGLVMAARRPSAA